MNHQDHRRCCADSGDFTTSDLDSCWAPRNPLMPLSLINCWGRRRARLSLHYLPIQTALLAEGKTSV